MKPSLAHWLLFGAAGVALYAIFRPKGARAPADEAPAPASRAAPPSSMTKEEIEGKPELIAKAPAGYTRAIPKLPPEANSFARQGLSQPYGTVIGPQVLSDGNTYVAITESHFDDHVTNPRAGQKDKHWHKGSSMFMQT